MKYEGPERRRFARITGRFIVSYRVLKESENTNDLSQTKNISLGGMLLTTNRKFAEDTLLALEIRLPFDPDPIFLKAKVLESKEITKNLIYDTRLEFIAIDNKHKKILNDTVNYYLKRG